jgi:hypothetical protein
MKMSNDSAYMPNRPRVLTQFGGTTSTQLMTDACYR